MSNELGVWNKFSKIAEEHTDKIVVYDSINHTSLTYGGLRQAALAYSDALSICDECTIVLIGEPNLTTLPLFLACAYSNRCFVPLSDFEPTNRLMEIINFLPGGLLIASAQGLPRFDMFNPGAVLNKMGLIWQRKVSDHIIENKSLPFLVTHTSGSSGRPKAVAFSQETKLRRTSQSINLFNITSEDVVLCPTPLHHSLGQRHLMLVLMTGATLVKVYPFSPGAWIEAVEKYEVSFAIPVATHLKILKPRIIADPSILKSFRCLVTSSASAEPEFKRSILDNADFEFWEIYGMTETACVTAVRYFKGADTAHLGKALGKTKVRIATNTANIVGEIEILSDCLSDTYWGEPARWRDAFTTDGYFKSGDLGRLDEDQNLFYVGRANESFESGGLMIFPTELETVITELGGLEDCVVFDIPNDILGNLIAVVFVASANLALRDIVNHVRLKLPKHMWPSRFFREDKFPKLSSGKVDRRALKVKWAS